MKIYKINRRFLRLVNKTKTTIVHCVCEHDGMTRNIIERVPTTHQVTRFHQLQHLGHVEILCLGRIQKKSRKDATHPGRMFLKVTYK